MGGDTFMLRASGGVFVTGRRLGPSAWISKAEHKTMSVGWKLRAAVIMATSSSFFERRDTNGS